MAYQKDFIPCPVIEETVDLQVIRYNKGRELLVVHLRTGSCQRLEDAINGGMNHDAEYRYTPEELAMFKRIRGGVPAC